MKRTKGSWYVKGQEICSHIITKDINLPSSYHTRIASLAFCQGNPADDANAHLMAASPKLYKACLKAWREANQDNGKGLGYLKQSTMNLLLEALEEANSWKK